MPGASSRKLYRTRWAADAAVNISSEAMPNCHGAGALSGENRLWHLPFRDALRRTLTAEDSIDKMRFRLRGGRYCKLPGLAPKLLKGETGSGSVGPRTSTQAIFVSTDSRGVHEIRNRRLVAPVDLYC